MDMQAMCDFCRRFWLENEEELWPRMGGFDRDMTEMEGAARAGCHCCSIFLANVDLLKPHAELLDLGNNNRIFVVINEELLSLCFLHSGSSRTPLRFVLKSAKFLDPKLHSVQHDLSTSSATSFAQVKEWLKNCLETHPTCGPPQPDYRPTRLLHINEELQCVRLFHKDSFPANLRYATVSHCWGQMAIRCLQRDNLGAFEQGIAFTQLAKTFQEVATVCQQLEIEFVWIDCFCIIQDSVEDWTVEALQMQHIYSNSFLNIAATDSKDSHGGLFRDRDIKALQPFKVSLIDMFRHRARNRNEDEEELEKVLEKMQDDPDHPGAVFYLSDIDQCWDRFEQAPLNRRSWVLQERFLSPRVLHYDKDQLVWECDSVTACDRFPGPEGIAGLIPDKKRLRVSIDKLKQMQSSQRAVGQELHDFWKPLIRSYTGSGVTVQTDRLIALEGIAQRLAQIYGCSYVAGLFTRSMESQLAWQLDDDEVDVQSRIPDATIAPSWSWASFLGRINMLPQWDSVDTDQTTRRVEAHDLLETVLCNVTNKESLAASWSPSVDVDELPLKLHGFMAQVRFVDFSEARCWPHGKHRMMVWRREDNKGPEYSYNGLPDDENRPPDDLWPLAYSGGGGGTRDFSLHQGGTNANIAVHSLTSIQEDYFLVRVALDPPENFRNQRSLYLMPVYEVTKYEPQDIWEKVDVRMIQGLVLERLEVAGNRFRRIGVFTVDARERKNFWRAAVETDIPAMEKHNMPVHVWPDLSCDVKLGQSFKYDSVDDAVQYQIVIV